MKRNEIDRGRDGWRVPLPWSSSLPSFGFGPETGDEPWLPQPAWFAEFAASVQDAAAFLQFVCFKTKCGQYLVAVG